MKPPKCRICGTREFDHHWELAAAAPVIPTSDGGTQPGPKPRSDMAKPRRWTDDTDAAGEPTEIALSDRRPARFYAPPGQCVYCDRRRAAAAKTMRAVRERGEA